MAASTIQYAPHLADWYGDYINVVEADMDRSWPRRQVNLEKLGTSLASRMRIIIAQFDCLFRRISVLSCVGCGGSKTAY